MNYDELAMSNMTLNAFEYCWLACLSTCNSLTLGGNKKIMKVSWKESIYLQREDLARKLHEPLAHLATRCMPVWGNSEELEGILAESFQNIPHCSFLYCVDTDGIQICNNIGQTGPEPGNIGRDRSGRPYMKENLPPWGFLLSDAYISERRHRPSLTALQLVRNGENTFGYLGADFDLRNLPVTSELFEEPGYWRQVKGDPAIRGTVFQQCRVDSIMDGTMDQALSILEELMTIHGVYQCLLDFSRSQAMIWNLDDPLTYRILDHEALSDPDICLAFPSHVYPDDARIPQENIKVVLGTMQCLRVTDPTIYLRTASINIFNGMVGLTFSCDGSHYMPYDEFLKKDASFWF